MFDIRRSQKDSKGSHKGTKGAKGNQAEPRKLQKINQKGAKDQENHQKSCLFFSLSFLFKIVKTVMAHL